MTRLTHSQWSRLHQLSLQIHETANEDELIYFVIHQIPKSLDFNYSVWHELDERNPAINKALHVPKAYVDALKSVESRFIPNLHTHPVVSGLGIASNLIFPKTRVYTMDDFATNSQMKETPIMKEFYSQLEVRDNACIQLTDPKYRNVFMCFNTATEFTSEQKYSMQVLREHISSAFRNFRKQEESRERYELTLPSLDYHELTARELEALPHVLHGKSNIEISTILGISKRTVEKHVASILEKSGMENRKVLISEATFNEEKISG